MTSEPDTDSHQQNVIVARDLCKSVPTAAGELHILSAVNLQIKRGERVAIVGVSGSGKSTLLGLLAGLDLASSGAVFLSDTNLNELDEDGRAALRAQHVGFVFQSFQLMQGLTAVENVMLPLELAGAGNARKRAGDMLKRVGLEQRLTHYPKQLSGGEQQRVAVARAFASEPSVLFADEPTGNLDKATGERVVDVLFQLNKELGTTLILVTHDEALAQKCDRQIRLEDGRIVA